MSFNYKITKNSSLPEVLEIIPDHLMITEVHYGLLLVPNL